MNEEKEEYYKDTIFKIILAVGIPFFILFIIFRFFLGFTWFFYVFFYGWMFFALCIMVYLIWEHHVKNKENKIKLSEFKGAGTKDDPIIINSHETLPYPIKIDKSKLFVLIHNCDVGFIKLYKSENITIKSCKIERLDLKKSENITIKSCKVDYLDLDYCSNIYVKNSSVNYKAILSKCYKIKIKNCTIKKFTIILSYNNLIKNNSIKKIKNDFSKGNIFEKNTIPEHELVKLERAFSSNFKNLYLILFYLVIVLFISLIIFIATKNLIATIIVSLIVSIVLFIVVAPFTISLIKDDWKNKKIKKYPSNKVI